MRKVLSIILAVIIASGMSLTTFAAETLGDTDFPQRVGGNGTPVSKTVKTRKETYTVRGIYYPAEGKEVLRIMNEERKDRDLKPLTWESSLLQPALQRALEQYLFFDQSPPLSHKRPNGSDWSTVSPIANGENIACGDSDAESVMAGWMNSPGHKANILDEDYTSVAVACVETDQTVYWVQLFHAGKTSGQSNAADEAEEKERETVVNTSASSSENTVTSKSIVSSLNSAKTTAAGTSVTFKNVESIPVDAIKAASNWGATNRKTVSVVFNTLNSTGKSTQGQLAMNPDYFLNNKNAVKTGIRVDDGSVSGAVNAISAFYPGMNFAAIKCDQNGNYGGTVSIAAKAKLTGLDTKKLQFYIYDAKTGKITKLDIGSAGYTIDKNNYLRFNTKKGGHIIITDKAL